MPKFGSKLGYNDSDGNSREADRVGHALGSVHEGRVKVQRADGSTDAFEFISDLDGYDEEHGGNRGYCCWPVH
jgi:hypothetical protein